MSVKKEFNIPEDLNRRILQRMRDEQAMPDSFAEWAFELALDSEAHKVTVDDAAALVLDLLSREQKQLILDCAEETGRKPLDYIVSYCRLAEERGETAKLMTEHVHDAEPVEVYSAAGTCLFCKKPFTATRRGQKFCPDPDDGSVSCGRQAMLAEMHAKRPVKAKGDARREWAPPQRDIVAEQRALQAMRE